MTNLAHTIPADTSWLIGIAGRAGHGKDTIGNMLVDYGYQRVAFADKVREAALAIDPIIQYELDHVHASNRLSYIVQWAGWDKAKMLGDVRQLLQRIGTEMGRNMLAPNVWIDALRPTLDRRKKYVITDVRFENEIEFITSNGGVVWFVQRPQLDSEPVEHASEMLAPSLCDEIIMNDGTLDELRAKVDTLIRAE